MANDFVFLYWDDLGDSQEHVDNQINEKTFLDIEREYLYQLKDRKFYDAIDMDVYDDEEIDPDA